jgi:hypothetical protein
MTKERRSPLKAKPLRNPGQSLDEQIHDLISDYALGPAVFALFLVLLAALEWVKYAQAVPPKPVLYSVPARGSPWLCFVPVFPGQARC